MKEQFEQVIEQLKGIKGLTSVDDEKIAAVIDTILEIDNLAKIDSLRYL